MDEQPSPSLHEEQATISTSPFGRLKARLARLRLPRRPRESRKRLASVLYLSLPLVGMYIGQFLLRAIPQAQAWGFAIMAANAALLILRFRPAFPAAQADWAQAAVGLLIMLPLAANSGGWKHWAQTWQLFLVWGIACLFVIAAVVRLEPRPIRLGLPAPESLDRRDWLIVGLLLVGALLLRVPYLETVPMGVDPDEASLALSAADAAEGVATDPFATGWATHPTLQFFLNGLAIRAFGRTFFAMRLPWTIAGSLMVVALYLLGRACYGRRVGVLAGVLALGSNTAIHFSRLGLNNNGDSLFAAWVLAALWAAGATGSAWAYAIAGFGLGFAQYFYFGTRAIPFVVLATLLVWLVADRRGTLRAWKLLLGFALVTLVTAGPLFGHWLRSPGSVSEHLFLTMPFSDKMQQLSAQMGLPEWKLWWYQVRDSLLVFTVTPDRGTFYHPQQAMLHPAQGPIFLIGLLAVFARIKKPAYQGLVAWMLVVLTLGSVLITDAATFHRLLGVLPAAILAVAIGLDAGVEKLAQTVGWTPQMASRVAALVAVVLIALDIHFYFGVYNVHQAYKTPTQEAVTIAALDYEWNQGHGTFLLCTREGVDESGKVYHSPTAFVSHERFLGCVPAVLDRLNTEQPLHFYILPDQADILPVLQARFPGGRVEEYKRRMDGMVLVMKYAVAQ
ncbi:MAG: glycosyltransferase family 39 protein [Anaerolineae bacterium]|nr:glycosyltransferase family 39 protein [Anaerolineae bacterium]